MDNWFQKNLEKNLYGIGKSLIRVFTSAQNIENDVKTLTEEFKKENQKFTLVVDPKEFALKDGKTPEKYVDYWTDKDIEELLSRLPKPKDGKKGKDGKNADNEKIFKALVKQLPKPEKVDYDKITKEIKQLFKENKIQEKDILPQINIIVEKSLKDFPTRKEIEQQVIDSSIKELDKLLNNPESFKKIARGIEKLPLKEKLDYKKGLKNKPSHFGGGAIAGFETFSGVLGVMNGGTGTSTAFTEGSIVFAGASGVYSEDNEHFKYFPDYEGNGVPYFIYGGIPKFIDDADPYLPEYRMVFTSDIDSYAGFFLENKNAGQFASTDLIWNNDATREALHYFDIGFNSYEYDWNGSPEDYTAFNQRDRAYIYNVNQGITILGFQGGLTGESAERAYTVIRSGNTLTVADQSQLVTGRRITYTTTGTPIGGLTSGQYYYIVKISGTSVSLSSTMENALDSVVITLSSAGTGVHTITLESSIISFGGGGASYSNVYLLMLKDGSMLARNSSGGVSYGQDNLATGNNSVAIGTQNTASASQAGAYGYRVLSTAANAQAFGYNFTNSTTNTVAIGHGAATLIINSSGNVGIGISPTAKLSVDGNINLIPTAGVNRTIDFGVGLGATALKLYSGGTNLDWGWGLEGGRMVFYGVASGGNSFVFRNGGALTGGTNAATLTLGGVLTTLSTIQGTKLGAGMVPVSYLDVLGTAANGTVGTESTFRMARSTTGGLTFGQAAEIKLGRWKTPSSFSPDSRLDFTLKHVSDGTLTGDTTVMTMQSNGAVGIGIIAPLARLHVEEATLGSAVQILESTATNDDVTETIYQNRVATTNATVTTLHTFTVPASTTYMIEAVIVARRTGGTAGTAEDGAGFVVRGTYKNVAGTATIIGAVNADFTAEDQAAWDATFDVTGATVRARVTGATDNNVTWHITARVYQLST